VRAKPTPCAAAPRGKGLHVKTFFLILATILLNACAPTKRAIAYNDYVKINFPRAEQGLIPWPEYYEGMYERAVASKSPATRLNSIIEMIDFAWRYEKREITQDEFIRARRVAQAEQENG
jgi:hypothetical protein